MMVPHLLESGRREHPRIPTESFCSEHQPDATRHALILDLSPDGLRLTRPARGWFRERTLRLELEIPEVDEIVWATGAICFDHIWRASTPVRGGLSGVLRTSGVRLIAAPERHRRLLRDYVTETWRRRHAFGDPGDGPLTRASCYLRG